MRQHLALCLLVACAKHGTAPSDVDLQMNDLSVLLPLPTTSAELSAMIAPTDAAVGGQLFPQAIYQAAAGGLAFDSLRVVAFRLDPCFGQLGSITDPTTCQNQLRVVFQPVFPGQPSGPATAADAAIHAFYSITREQLVGAANEIVAAREAAAGTADLGPLAPHPVVAQQGLAGTFAKALGSIITKYAGAANLVRFTQLQVELFNAPAGIDLGGELWEFSSFNVADGAATPRPIATLAQSQSSMGLEAATVPLEAQLSPMTTSTDDLSLLASYMKASQASPAARQSAFDAALRIENPHDNSPDTIDCASCHMAQPAIQLVGMQLGMSATGDPNAFVPSARIPAADLAQTTQLVGATDRVLNIHAFSYRGTSPMIDQRVINETAANLAYVATLLQ